MTSQTNVSEAVLNELRIPADQLFAPVRTLTDPYQAVFSYLEFDGAANKPYADEADFEKRALKKVERIALGYRVPGVAMELVVSHEGATILDRTRNKRQAGAFLLPDARKADPEAAKLLPEEVLTLVGLMPEPGFFQRALLLIEPNPRDPWLQQHHSNSDFKTAMEVSRQGELRLFSSELNEFTWVNVCHEWSHRLEHHLNPGEWSLFWDAVTFEWASYVPWPYMLTSTEEHWAGLGQQLLHTDTQNFLDACRLAPLRTVAFMMPFERRLLAVPQDQQSRFHKAYLARCKYTRDVVVPNAKLKLAKAASMSNSFNAW